MKIKIAVFVGNSGNAGTLLSFISICSHVPHERTPIWDKYEHNNLLIFIGLQKMFPDSRFDEGGMKGNLFWRSIYPQLLFWPVPEGKGPGDAIKLGLDLRRWVEAGLKAIKL
jgi:hypothetical protein